MYIYNNIVCAVGKVSALFAAMNNVAEMNIDEWMAEWIEASRENIRFVHAK